MEKKQNRNDDDDGLRSVGLCGATQMFDTLDEEQTAILADIDNECTTTTDDACSVCTDHQVCMYVVCMKEVLHMIFVSAAVVVVYTGSLVAVAVAVPQQQ